jgi:uncharacterized protein
MQKAAVIRLLSRLKCESASWDSRIHGPGHWRSVATNGLVLAEHVSHADPLLVLLFALLHDAARLDDGLDAEHGPRAARLTSTLMSESQSISPSRCAVLMRACRDHSRPVVSDNPTIGVCWDADRLDLARVGVSPQLAFMSTDHGRRLIVERSRLPRPSSWSDLFTAYENLGALW